MAPRKLSEGTFTGGTGMKNPPKEKKIYAPPKPGKSPKKVGKTKQKTTGKEKDAFLEKRESSSHRCEICGEFIPEPLTYCFAHKLGKGQYPEFRLDINNISLVCSLDCHQKVDDLCKGNAFGIKESLLAGENVVVDMIE